MNDKLRVKNLEQDTVGGGMTLRPSKSKVDLPNVYSKTAKKIWFTHNNSFWIYNWFIPLPIIIVLIIRWNPKLVWPPKKGRGWIGKDSLASKHRESKGVIIKTFEFTHFNHSCKWSQHWISKKLSSSWSQYQSLWHSQSNGGWLLK